MQISDYAPAYVKAISPYQPGKPVSELAREMGIDESRIIKLASNENPLGPSPRALAAIAGADFSRYPDGNGFELKAALAAHTGVDATQIVLGNGSGDVLELVTLAFLAPGLKAVYSEHAFAVYPLATQARGAIGVVVKARDFGHDLEAMRAAIDAGTRVVFVANPNNPTGTLHTPAAIKAFIESVPTNVIVVLDEAYNEYLSAEQKAPSAGWIGAYPNLVVTRTFSKAYGLAGLRVGYGLTSVGVADMLNRVRQAFNVNGIAQIAAIAALDDDEFVRRSFELNRASMRQLTEGFNKLGRKSVPSWGNFIMVHVGDARAVNAKLLRQGVIVRPIEAYGLPEYLRVSVGLPEENARFLAVLREAL